MIVRQSQLRELQQNFLKIGVSTTESCVRKKNLTRRMIFESKGESFSCKRDVQSLLSQCLRNRHDGLLALPDSDLSFPVLLRIYMFIFLPNLSVARIAQW